MLEQYMYEIITLIIIITLLAIYLVIKKSNKDENFINDSITEQNNDNQHSNVPESEKPTLLDRHTLKPKDDTDNNSTMTTRQKCEVPKHDKIVKENFREFKGVKLLVAEDNVINQRVISGLLSTSGIEITMADDGQIALDILEKNDDFDMVLMDAHMPNIDGFEATRQIRANDKYDHIVVIALSGDTAPDDVAKMTQAGMERHLEKPLRMDAFYDILYAYTKSDNDSSEFIEVIMTKELNGDKGLSVCGGDENFYKDILNEFVATYSNSYEKIHTLLEKGDFVSADALLLDLIGITANIGADNINRIALELKESIRDTHEKSYFTTLDEYDAHLKILLKDIQSYLGI